MCLLSIRADAPSLAAVLIRAKGLWWRQHEPDSCPAEGEVR